jgi:hypothetical protein
MGVGDNRIKNRSSISRPPGRKHLTVHHLKIVELGSGTETEMF